MKNCFKNIDLGKLLSYNKVFDADGAELDASLILDEIKIKSVTCGYTVARKIKNLTAEIIKVKELGYFINGIDFGKNPKDDYYYCNESARLFGTLTIPVDFDKANEDAPKNEKYDVKLNKAYSSQKDVESRIGSSAYQPFPAVLISNYESKRGLIVGSMSQDVFSHEYEISHTDGQLCLSIFSTFKCVSYRELLPNETLTDEWFIGVTETADNVNGLFDIYTAELRKRLKKDKSAHKHSLIWDSWNDGIFRNVSESMLIREAEAVKKLFPTVDWFQLDDGYSAVCNPNVEKDAHGIGVAFEGEDGIDKNKFPHGLKYYTEKIKEIGLKPALWIGGFCPITSKIYKERPEWFIDYRCRLEEAQPLDESIPEVRNYMTFALDKLLVENGFEGLKLDFWSYGFEDKEISLKNKAKSGYELRKWWQNEIRNRLPDYGYVEIGCDISLGNPFLGEKFDNYRFGIDVGAGNWNNLKITFFWATACLSTHTGDMFIPNSDSIGIMSNLNFTDFMFLINFKLITRTMVEISGRFSDEKIDKQRLAVLRKAVQYINNGEDVYFAQFDYRKNGILLPNIVYIKSFYNGLPAGKDDRTVALFNAEEKIVKIKFCVTDLEAEDSIYKFENIWDGTGFNGNSLETELLPHESRIYTVKRLN